MASRFYNISTDNTLGGVSPSDAMVVSQKAIKEYVDGKSPDIDNSTITLNASDKLQAAAVVNQNSGIVKTWTGTLQEYEDILVKDSSTTYIITDDEVGGTSVYTKSQTDAKIVEGCEVYNQKQITNCVTEIPQNIDLELSRGHLILKTGSKVYVPNGAGVFDNFTLASDLLETPTPTDGNYMLFVNSDGSSFQWRAIELCASGTSDPATIGTTYYDTVTNKILSHNVGRDVQISLQVSFPIATFTASGGVVTSIDQVFNGFGYIGSTVFALPGVKGLSPNGRNEDGSLKSNIIENTQIVSRTFSSGIDAFCMLSPNRESYPISTRGLNSYIEENNLFTGSAVNGVAFDITKIICDSSGKIKSFTPKTTFHAVDYNYTDRFALIDLSNLTSVGINKLGPRVYQIIGYVVNSATTGSSVAAYGICRVELYPNGLAVVDFNLQFTAPGTTGDFNWGLNRDILRTLNANIPIITPISGTCSYYDANGIYSDGLSGYSGALTAINQFWAFGRLYDTAGNIGGWGASQMSAGIKVVGRCYGTYTV